MSLRFQRERLAQERAAREGSLNTGGANTGTIITIVIIIIIILFVLFFIIWLLNRPRPPTPDCVVDSECGAGFRCVANKCVAEPTCFSEPNRPNNLTISYDQLGDSATLSWSPVVNADRFCLYRKLADPTVSKVNYDDKVVVTSTSHMFTGLLEGTHYFVVTAMNDCGESDESFPSVLAAICSSIPPATIAPVVTQDTNDCGGPSAAELVDISFPDISITDGVYIITGTGQAGAVDDYLTLIEGASHSDVEDIAMKCGGVESSHYVQYATEADLATLNFSGPPPALTGSMFKMEWLTIPGAEEYVAWFVCFDTLTGVFKHYGGFAPGSATSLDLNVESGLEPAFALVVGYKLCNKSEKSLAGMHTSPIII